MCVDRTSLLANYGVEYETMRKWLPLYMCSRSRDL